MAIMGSACIRGAMPTALEAPRQMVSTKQPSPDVGEHDAMLGIEEFDQSGLARRNSLAPEGDVLAPDEPSSGLHRTGPTAHVLADPAVRRAYQGQPSAGGLAR